MKHYETFGGVAVATWEFAASEGLVLLDARGRAPRQLPHPPVG